VAASGAACGAMAAATANTAARRRTLAGTVFAARSMAWKPLLSDCIKSALLTGNALSTRAVPEHFSPLTGA
jgi:hypothetical protein